MSTTNDGLVHECIGGLYICQYCGNHVPAGQQHVCHTAHYLRVNGMLVETIPINSTEGELITLKNDQYGEFQIRVRRLGNEHRKRP